MKYCSALLLLLLPAVVAAQHVPSDAELQALIAYGQTWKAPDRLYENGLPYSSVTQIAGMRSIKFFTDHANIALVACRAKLLLQQFGVAEARALYKANRVHAILEVESMTQSGAQKARKEYGGQNINLVYVDGQQLLQPLRVGNATAQYGAGFAIGTVNTVGNFAFVNMMGLASGLLTRSFAYDLPSIPATANFILVRYDGKQQRFSASFADLNPELAGVVHTALHYAPSDGTSAGKPAQIRFSLRGDDGKPINRPLIIEADSIWRVPVSVGGESVKAIDLPAASVLSYKLSGDDGGVYQFDAPTTGLEKGSYEVRIRIGARPNSLSFRVK